FCFVLISTWARQRGCQAFSDCWPWKADSPARAPGAGLGSGAGTDFDVRVPVMTVLDFASLAKKGIRLVEEEDIAQLSSVAPASFRILFSVSRMYLLTTRERSIR